MSDTYQPDDEPEIEPSEFERDAAAELEEAEEDDEGKREHG